jgi:hypothetical protein
MRYYGVQKVGVPRKNVLIDDLSGKCECGAKKTGIKDYKPGHSSWCPVKEP